MNTFTFSRFFRLAKENCLTSFKVPYFLVEHTTMLLMCEDSMRNASRNLKNIARMKPTLKWFILTWVRALLLPFGAPKCSRFNDESLVCIMNMWLKTLSRLIDQYSAPFVIYFGPCLCKSIRFPRKPRLFTMNNLNFSITCKFISQSLDFLLYRWGMRSFDNAVNNHLFLFHILLLITDCELWHNYFAIWQKPKLISCQESWTKLFVWNIAIILTKSRYRGLRKFM